MRCPLHALVDLVQRTTEPPDPHPHLANADRVTHSATPWGAAAHQIASAALRRLSCVVRTYMASKNSAPGFVRGEVVDDAVQVEVRWVLVDQVG